MTDTHDDESSVSDEFIDDNKDDKSLRDMFDAEASEDGDEPLKSEDKSLFVDAFKGEDKADSGSEFNTSIVSSYTISRHEFIWEPFIQVDDFLEEEENKVGCVQICFHSDWI